MTEQHQQPGEKPPWPPIGLPPGGLVCRGCGCRHFHVLYTRPKVGHILRLRECRNCGKRISTREREE